MSIGSASESKFDPYLKWLGITPRDQPPNHYRLLGIDPLIDDPDVIENAAEQRMRHLRTFATGQYVQLSQQLLNEVSAARVCLLNPAKKTAYDGQLRAKLASSQAALNQTVAENPTQPAGQMPQLVTRKVTATPAAQALPQAKVIAPEAPQAGVSNELDLGGLPIAGSGGSVMQRRKKKSIVPGMIGLILALAMVGAILFLALGKQEPPIADQTNKASENKAEANLENVPSTEVPQKNDEVSSEQKPPEVPTPEVEPVEKPETEQPLDKSSSENEPNETSELQESGEAKDLLAEVDLKRDIVLGNWQKTDEGLEDHSPGFDRIIVARELPERYELRFIGERVDVENNNGAFHIGLPLDNRQLEVVLDYQNSPGTPWASGLMTVHNSLQGSSPEPLFPIGKPTESVIRVSKEVVSIFIAGKLIGTFKAPYTEYRDLGEWRILEQNAIALGVFQGLLRFNSITLTPLDESENNTFLATTLGPNVESNNNVPDSSPEKLRHPIPDAASRQASLKSVQQIFGEELSKAKTSATQLALAAQLVKQGRETQENATDQFVLFAEALRLATEAGDVDTALLAWDESAATFDVDTLNGTAKVLTNLSKKVKISKQQQSLAQRAGEVFDAAISADKLELAGEMSELAAAAAKKAKDPELTKLTSLRVKEFQGYKQMATEAAVAKKTLDTKPDDAQANLLLGRFLCLTRDDWKAGLPLLAKSGDEKLNVLATDELAEPSSAADMNKLADAWWAYGNTAEADLRKPYLLHAAEWYEQATEAGLSGLDASKAAKRIAEVSSLGGRTVSQEQCISYAATYTASSPTAWGPLGTLLTGFGTMHGGEFAFCTGTEAGAHITIDLGAEKTVQRLDVENRRVTSGEFDRAKGFGVWLSSVAGERGQQVWQSTEALPNWNIVLPKPIRARYVTIGFPLGKAEHFHLASVKVFGTQPQTSHGAGGSGRVRAIHRTLGYALREHPSDAIAFGGHWYKYFDNSVEPSEAQRQCALMGGYLVCLETEKEYQFIRTLPQKTGFWLGLHLGAPQKWSWINGAPLSINHWASGDPTGDAATADFGTGQWSDSNGPTRYVCEWEF